MALSRTTELAGRELAGRYRLLGPVGVGASAKVYLAEDAHLHRRVAVKVLHPALAGDPSFLRRFQAEARAAAALNHPNVVTVYDWGEDGVPFIVTEYLGGGSLRAMLDQAGTLTVSQALVVGLEAARALHYAHRRGFVHRDIKPGNLLFGEDGRLRIADFGLARALAAAAWTEPAGVVLGTAKYASPEQAVGDEIDGRSDVYSLALVLAEVVTGAVPHAKDTAVATLSARVKRAIDPLPELGPLAAVVAAAGTARPDERSSAAELGRALMVVAAELAPPEPLPLAVPVLPRLARPTQDERSLDGDGSTVMSRSRQPLGNEVSPVSAPLPVASPSDQTPPLGAVDPLDGEFRRRRRRRRRRVLRGRNLVALGAVVVGALVAALLLIPRPDDLLTIGTTTHPVGNYVGRRYAEVSAEFGANKWTVTTAAEFSDARPAGEVLGQQPAAAAELAERGNLVLTVSKGPRPVAVPDLSGQVQADAEAALGARKLTAKVTPRNDEAVPSGVVMEVTGVGSEVAPGSEVELVVSAGPVARVVPAAASDPAAVEAELAALGLVGSRSGAYSDTVPEGQVIGTEPGEGTSVERGSTITIVVSRGPELIAIPDLAGKTPGEAAQILNDLGFETNTDGAANKPVLITSPPSGETARRGSTVTIITRR